MPQSSDVLLNLTRRWWMLAIGLVLGGVLGGLASLLMTPTYQSTLYFMVVTQSEDVENTAAYEYTQAYSRLPTVPTVVGDVFREYGITPSPENIQDFVDVEVPLNTPLFQIIVSAEDPGQAAALANDLGDRVSSFVADTLTPGTGYRAAVVAEASMPRQPISLDWNLNIALGAAVGIVLAGMLALFWDDLRLARKRRRSTEVDESGSGVSSKIWVPGSNGHKAVGSSAVASSRRSANPPESGS